MSSNQISIAVVAVGLLTAFSAHPTLADGQKAESPARVEIAGVYPDINRSPLASPYRIKCKTIRTVERDPESGRLRVVPVRRRCMYIKKHPLPQRSNPKPNIPAG